MGHAMLRQTPEQVKTESRKFGYLFGGIFLFLGTVLPLWKGHGIAWAWVGAGLGFAALALLAPVALKPLYRGWMWLGGALGAINAVLILGLVYLVFIVPTGLLMRAFGRDPLKLKMGGQPSYREPRSAGSLVERMEAPF